MARIKTLPGLDVIKGFKGTLDFALWRGLPYVRAWPRTPRHHLTPATLAAAALFGLILKSYRLLADTIYAAFQEDAADQTRIGRDIFMSAVYGKLHEAAMTDFLTLLTECRDSLALLANLLAALRSVATDSLQVRGEDQLFSFKGALAAHASGLISGANGYIESPAVPAGQIWKVTGVAAYLGPRASTRFSLMNFHNAVAYAFHADYRTIAAAEICSWSGEQWLDPGDTICAYFTGAVAADGAGIWLTGHVMTLES